MHLEDTPLTLQAICRAMTVCALGLSLEEDNIHGEWIPGYQGLTVLPRRWLLYVCHRLFTQVSVDYMTTKFHRSKTPSV